jgi:hypothetical protein
MPERLTDENASGFVGPNGEGLWPTATTHDHGTRYAQGGMPLGMAVRMWPTPAARDGNNTNTVEHLLEGRHIDQLANRVKMVEAGIWTTPTARDFKGPTITEKHPQGFNKSLANEVGGGSLNPTWVEWLMGWPLGWTDLRPSGTDKFHKWPHSHGIPYTNGFSTDEKG